MIDYKEQIKSPLWQKKRLEILSRDKFACVVCGSTDKQLHVHHKRYIAGRNYWDYPDELLVTLCEDCHRKFHGKETESTNKISKKDSKNTVPFYVKVLTIDSLTPMDKIIYSFLLSRSIMSIDNIFSGTWNIDKDILSSVIRSRNNYIPLNAQFYEDVSRQTSTSIGTVFNTMKKLRDLKFIIDEDILATEEIVFGGFFPLRTECKLRGLSLILYSFLKYRAQLNGGCLIMTKEKIALAINSTPCEVKKFLHKLYANKLAERKGIRLYIK